MAKAGFGAAAEAVEEAQKQGPQEYEKLKVEKDTPAKRIRFVLHDGDNSVITFTEHWTEFNNGWKRNFACPNEEIGDDKCLICRSKRGTDYVDDQRKPAHMINVLDREDGKLKVWKFSPMVMARLLEHIKTNGTIGDRDYSVQFISNEDKNIKSKFVYIIEPVGEATELTTNDKTLVEGRYKLETLIPTYNEESISQVMAKKPGEGNNSNGKKAAPSNVAEDFMKALKGASSANPTTSPSVADLLNSVSTKTETVVTTAEATKTEEPAVTSEKTSDFWKMLEDIK